MTRSFPTAYTVLIIISCVIALATYVMPAGNYKYQETDGTVVSFADKSGEAIPLPGTYETIINQPQGFAAVAIAPIKGFYDAQDIIVFVLILGGFINIAIVSGTINSGVMSLVRRFQGREQLLIPVLMGTFALGGTVFGMGEELVGFYPVIIPIMLAGGFDTVTAAATILLGAGVGVVASTVNPFATGVAAEAAGISMIEGVVLRLIMLVLMTTVTIAFVMRYAMIVKKNPRKSLVFYNAEANRKRFLSSIPSSNKTDTKMTGRQKIILTMFISAFAVMIYGVIPFSDFGITAIPTMGWWFSEISRIFLVVAIAMGIAAGMSEKDLVNNFLEGVKDISGTAIIIGVARGIKILMDDGAIAGTFLNYGEQLVSGLSSYAFICGTFLVEFLLSFLLPSSTGLANFSVPIIAPIGTFAGVEPSLIVTAFQTANGLVNLITPTSAILMVGLTISEVPFNKWLVFVTPLILVLSAATIVLLTASIAIN